MNKEQTAEYQDVIKQHKGIIYKVASSYCKNSEDKQDLIQEIMIQVWHSFANYNPAFKRSTWMYRIALNVAISFYRKSSRRERISEPMHENLLEIAETDFSRQEQDFQLLQRCIHELPEIDRALMVLYLEEYNHKEIAEILGISETNVSTKVFRLKEKIKQRFLTLYHA